MKLFSKIAMSLIITVIFSLGCAMFSGCDTIRKLNGAESNFPDKVAKAEQLSFTLDLNYQSGEESTDIRIVCYKNASEYAYDYYLPDSRVGTKYRNLYADDKLYEVVTNSLNVGSYYTIDNVGVDDQNNLLYWVCQNIVAIKVLALVTEAKKETENNVTLYRYDLTFEGNEFSVWYNASELVKLAATVVSEDNSGNQTTEKYTAVFSEFKFENVDSTPFTRPENLDGLYHESPISFEDWVSIINNFGKIISTAK